MRVRYVVLILLVLLSVITYMDRICIGVAGKQMQADLDISESQWGWVLSAFLISYGLFEIPTGALGDRWGQRKVLTRIVLWWSAFTALTPLARNYYLLVATRFLFGMGEAGAYPNASGSIVRWFPIAERGRAQGLVWGASRLGGALTPLIVVPLVKTVGWQSCFWLFGAIGVVWAAVWAWWYRDHPQEHQSITPSELVEIGTQHAPGGHTGVPWGRLFASPQLWLIVAMYWFYVFGFIFFMFWLPKYLTVGRGMSDSAMAVVVAIMFTAGAVGNVAGGYGSDLLTRRFGLSIGRKGIGATALALSGVLMAAAALSPNKWLTAALVVLCFGITDAMLPCSWAICLDVGRRYSGSVSGAMNSAGQAAGAISTALYGYLIEWNGGNYDTPLLFLAPSLLVSAVLFALIDPTRPLVPEPLVVEPAKAPACV